MAELRDRREWQSREHFLDVATGDAPHHDRRGARLADKRGTDAERVPMDWGDAPFAQQPDRAIVELGDALTDLARFDSELARLVDLRFLSGMDERETAALLGTSERTQRRRWAQARACLHATMTGSG